MAYNLLPKDNQISEVINQEYGNKRDGSRFIQHNLGGIYWYEWIEEKSVQSYTEVEKVPDKKEDLCSILCKMWSEGKAEDSFTEEEEPPLWMEENAENHDVDSDTENTKLLKVDCLPGKSVNVSEDLVTQWSWVCDDQKIDQTNCEEEIVTHD